MRTKHLHMWALSRSVFSVNCSGSLASSLTSLNSKLSLRIRNHNINTHPVCFQNYHSLGETLWETTPVLVQLQWRYGWFSLCKNNDDIPSSPWQQHMRWNRLFQAESTNSLRFSHCLPRLWGKSLEAMCWHNQIIRPKHSGLTRCWVEAASKIIATSTVVTAGARNKPLFLSLLGFWDCQCSTIRSNVRTTQ